MRAQACYLSTLLIFVYGIVRDRETMGEHASGRLVRRPALIVIALLALCVAALAALSLAH